MLRMIVEQKIQLQEMETKIEKWIKEIELQVNTGVGTSIAAVSTTKTKSTSQNLVEKLSKAMGDLSIKDKEIEKLRVQLEKIQDKKINFDNVYLDEIQKIFKLTKQLEICENESLIA